MRKHTLKKAPRRKKSGKILVFKSPEGTFYKKIAYGEPGLLNYQCLLKTKVHRQPLF